MPTDNRRRRRGIRSPLAIQYKLHIRSPFIRSVHPYIIPADRTLQQGIYSVLYQQVIVNILRSFSCVWEDWLPKLTLASCSTVSNSRKHLFTTSFEHNFLLISLWELKGVVLNSLRLLDNIPTKSQCDDVEIGCVETRVKRVP